MAGLDPAMDVFVNIFPGAYAHYHPLMLRACFGSRGDTGPFIHLNARQQLITAIVRSKDRGLALFYVEPIFAQRGNDVWIVRDENSVGARLWRRGEQRAKRVGTAIILVGRYDQAA